MKSVGISLATATTALLFAGCGSNEPASADTAAATETTMAVAHLAPTEGNTVTGIVSFSSEDGGVRVVVELENLSPGDHGFHVHQNGDCSAPNGTSAGGHFNPESQDHGARTADVRHVGDLDNVTADADGTARAEFVDSQIALSGEHSIVGRAVIVHAAPDDYSQPTGNAGARVACGVIELVGVAAE